MTSTITPNNAPQLARTDPVERLKDYEEALKFYLSLIDRPLHSIVFVENSDSDVSTLRQLVASRGLTDRVEFLCNYGDHRYSEMGRAYGEFKLLDYAMSESQMIRDIAGAHVVWKITGRYIVQNLRSIIACAPADLVAYIDMKNYPMRWADLRLMAWTVKGYDQVFRGVADDLGAAIHETALRDYLPNRARGMRIFLRFFQEPLVNGIRGVDNRNYSKGRNLIKFCIRSACRVLIPWFWL